MHRAQGPPTFALLMKVADNTVRSVVALYRTRLGERYAPGELRAIIRSVFADRLGWDHARVDTLPGASLSESELLQVYQPLDRLADGEPIQYVLGRTHFHGIPIQVDRRVLIPRPETEEMVDRILGEVTAPDRILDIGTGSGCIAIALAAAFPHADIVAVDVDEAALELATTNALSAGVQVTFLQGDVLADELPEGPFDLVVSNPPYIPGNVVHSVAPDVFAHEPHRALFVPAEDAMLFHRHIARYAHRVLTPCGQLWLEMHHDQGSAVARIMADAGFRNAAVLADMSGHDRFVHGRKAANEEERSR